MLILTKYKDYYDYLQGIYGVDPKLVLDRREGTPSKPLEYLRVDFDKSHKETFIICGFKIEGYRHQNKFYYGEQLLQLENEPDSEWQQRWRPKPYKNANIIVKDKVNVALEPIPGYDDVCSKLNCPILIKNRFGWDDDRPEGYDKFPQLEPYGLASFIPAEQIYTMLSGWLAKQVDNSQNITTPLSNKQKIESKGFDYVESFRHRK